MLRFGLCTVATAALSFTIWSPAIATSPGCLEEIRVVSERIGAVRAETAGDDDPSEVTVATDEYATEIPAEGAGPTENWFGSPPEAEAVEQDLTAARKAADTRDQEACHGI